MGKRFWTVGLIVGLLVGSPAIGLEDRLPDAYYEAPVIKGMSNSGKGYDLSDSILGEDSPIDVGGWLSTGYSSKSTGLFNKNPNNFNIRQAWVYIEKAVDGSEGFDIGGRFDAMYGADAQDTQAFGNSRGKYDFQDSFDHGVDGFALPQAYVEMAYKDISIKGGHFYTLLGYEVVTAPDNFFFSHAFTMYLSEAFTHTGALATYSALENLTLYGGWTAGWDTGFDQKDGGSSFLGGVSYSPIEEATITYILTAGNLGWIGKGYTHSIVLATNPIDKLTYVLQSDFTDTSANTDYANGGTDSRYETVGVNQYLIYQLLEELGIGVRGEWWRANGTSYGGLTGGFNIKPLPNLIIRPEGRYQFSDDNDDSKQVTNSNPAGLPVDVAMFAFDVILTF